MPAYALWALVERRGRGRFNLHFRPLLRPIDGAMTSAAATIGALPWRDWFLLGLGFLPAIVFFFWYDAVRFGSPLESGYGLASLPAFLQALRAKGLFSFAHVGMNLDYLLWHAPLRIADLPFFRPDGLGMSIFLTSPALLLAVRAPWRDRRTWLLAAAFAFTLLPSLLYYGGGWLRFGYRYALDAIPFALSLCAMAVASRGGLGRGWIVLILFGVLVNAASVYWAYHL
jgi:hypothetical protein